MKKLVLILALLYALPLFAQKSSYYPFKDAATGKYGYNDKSGKAVIPAQYDEAGFFLDNSLAPVKLGSKYGYIDRSGKLAIPVQFDHAEVFSGGTAIVKKGTLYGVIDEAGKEVVPFTMEDMKRHSHENILSYKKDGKWKFFDSRKKIELPGIYDGAGIFSDGRCAVKKNGMWGGIDSKGKEIIPYSYELAFYFNDGVAAVLLGKKWGAIDKSGKMIVAAEYDYMEDFYHGKTVVKKNAKWGVIDKANKPVIPLRYDSLVIDDYFNDAKIRAFIGNDLYLLDVSGKEHPVKECTDVLLYEDAPKSFLVGVKGNKKALLDAEGNLLSPVKYDNIMFNPDRPDVILAAYQGKQLMLGNDGKELTGLYDEVMIGDWGNDIWLKEGNHAYRANVKGFEVKAPKGMLRVNEKAFADQKEISVGDYLVFLTENKDAAQLASLLPDTNDVPAKCRPAYRCFFSAAKPKSYAWTTSMTGTNAEVMVPESISSKEVYKLLEFPVTGISYAQALAFCEWRTKRANEKLLSRENEMYVVYRLPSPAEWENIAAAGLREGASAPDTVNKEGCMLFNYQNTKECKVSQEKLKTRGAGVVYVSDFWPSNTGFYNVFGNAAEMTLDEGIAKGGSYMQYASQCNPAEQQRYKTPQPWIGFRCIAEYRSRYKDKDLKIEEK